MTDPDSNDLRAPTESRESGQGNEAQERDLSVALKNAVRLGLSLTATWAVAIGVKFLMPRYLGKERFGQFSWAESTASLAFLSIGFGLETYIQREVSTRPRHGSDFFGTVTLLRALFACFLTFGVFSYVAAKEPDVDLQSASILFAVTQFFIMVNASLAAMLQASTKVSGLALANVVTKVVWGIGVVVLINFTHRFPLLTLPLLAGEGLKTLLLIRSARKEVGLEFRIQWKETKGVLLISLPFFINTISYTMGNKLDITLLRELCTDAESAKKEVGLYAAAQNLASLAMLLAPLEGWVITPLLTRALKRNEHEFFAIVRRATEGVLVCIVPVTLVISLGSQLWMRASVGRNFIDGSRALEQLAPSFVFTYLAVLFATALIILKRSWAVTAISLSRLALQPVMMWLVIPWAQRNLPGDGAAGLGDAFVFSFLEFYVACAFCLTLGKRAFDKRLAWTGIKALLSFVVAALVHRTLMKAQVRPISEAFEFVHIYALLAAAIVYAIVFLALRGVQIADIRWVIQLVRNRKNRTAE
jgi:O-antigen/teichoic acid export membrane protein